MAEQKEGWAKRRLEQKRLKRERMGDSPERAAERKRVGTSPEEKDADKAARGRLWGPSF